MTGNLMELHLLGAADGFLLQTRVSFVDGGFVCLFVCLLAYRQFRWGKEALFFSLKAGAARGGGRTGADAGVGVGVAECA